MHAIIRTVADEKHLFRELLRLSAPCSPVVTIWGSMPRSLSGQLSKYALRGNLVRGFLFREHEYRINANTAQAFLSTWENVEAKRVTWGIRIDRVVVALARARDDISVFSSDFISDVAIERLLRELRDSGAIGDFDIVSEEQEEQQR